MSGSENNGDDKVGYKNPPKHTQFKPGQSGHPEGRPPKRPPDAASVAAVLDAPVDVRKGGKPVKMGSFEASVRRLVSLAINESDVRAARELLKLWDRYEVIAPAPEPWRNNSFTVPKDWDWGEWMEKFERDGPPPWPGERDGLPKSEIHNTGRRNT